MKRDKGKKQHSYCIAETNLCVFGEVQHLHSNLFTNVRHYPLHVFGTNSRNFVEHLLRRTLQHKNVYGP